MKPQKLSKKSNPSGEIMNLQDAFTKLQNTKHDSSFEQLGDWLNNNTSKPKKMKPLYKIAASFIATALVLIACSIPVQHEEEIGFMILGTLELESSELKTKLKSLSETKSLKIKPSEVNITDIVFESEGLLEEPTNKRLSELVMILPTSDYTVAESKKTELAAMFNFNSLEILPIEEEVERPLYEVALKKFDIELRKDLSDSVIANRIDRFLHENTQAKGDAQIVVDQNGNRIVEIVTEITEDNVQTKRRVESLLNDLSNKKEQLDGMTEEEVIKLKEQEIEKLNSLSDKKDN